MPRVERPSMASYGVPTAIDGALPWSWAEERLVRNWNYWVVTVDARACPHATPVWGLWRPVDESFWFSSAPDSLKARNMAVNPNVVVAADDAVEVVSVEGVASPDPGNRNIADEYAAKYEPDPLRRAELAEFVMANIMFVVRPIRAFGLIERADEFANSATRWVW